ncbi:hypothetical protein [Clostridium massiliodielmoense]|uniref:hypothetical protein n=1 Tax=Clostridium massiliodielmoense TaxID=1776385 RepID=UPI0001665793|nr:hypothetical protein [Clostridium massiliodielmoense]EDS76345.1 putative conserved protein [Clostridium botulinum C str. Eklund]KEH98326.1 hypothetical protein Z962_12810 [Clostridium botulinum C/D str. BKT12695]NEZ49404.1 hypothetical protein [Clostridium botulinum]
MKKNHKLLLCIFLLVAFTYCTNKIKVNALAEVATFNSNKSIEKYIPAGSELKKPMYPKRAKYIMYDDLYGDKEKEVIITLKDKNDKNTGGFIVLKKDGSSFKEVFKEYGENKNIYEVTFADLDGDNKDELLVGFSTEEPSKNILKIYKYSEKDDKLKEVASHNYSKLDVKLMESDNRNSDKKKIAIWNKLDGDVYLVNVLKYDDNKLIESKEDYPYYFDKVVKYYKLKLRKNNNKNSATMWYYLVDAQIKANKQKEALNSIYEVKKIKPKGYENMEDMFKKLEKSIVDNFK